MYYQHYQLRKRLTYVADEAFSTYIVTLTETAFDCRLSWAHFSMFVCLQCLGILNYFRSVERTLTISDAGLTCQDASQHYQQTRFTKLYIDSLVRSVLQDCTLTSVLSKSHICFCFFCFLLLAVGIALVWFVVMSLPVSRDIILY